MLREGSAFLLLIADARDGAPLGAIGLELHTEPARHGRIGYWVAAPERGRSVAPRAVRLLADWGSRALGLPRIEISVMPANVASQAVARKAGFRLRERRLEPFRATIEEFEVYVRETAKGGPEGRPTA